MHRPDESRQTSRPPRDERHDERGVVVPSRVMLVAIVLIAIAAATYIAGLGSGSESDVAAPASAREASSSSGQAASGGEASGSSSSPSASASSSPTASSSAKASAKAKAKAKKPDTDTDTSKAQQQGGQSSAASQPAIKRGQVSVSVFNNSSQRGLGARTSGKVKDAGWKVVGTDNWYGTIPQPTVYYPASMQAAAKLLAKDVGIDRVKPMVAPMRADRLTLIVTADYTA